MTNLIVVQFNHEREMVEISAIVCEQQHEEEHKAFCVTINPALKRREKSHDAVHKYCKAAT